ncbi:hypothetical protein LQZ19_09510 [Treponema primitia]|uniref:hypothetical protein n=1 Tax=Treponema primitia TaxID=88058 RepID=UPI00397F200A
MTSYELMALYDNMLVEINKLSSYTTDILKLLDGIDRKIDIINDLVISRGLDTNSISQITNSRREIINQVDTFATNFDMLKNHLDLINIKKSISDKKTQNLYLNFTDEINNIEELLSLYDEVTTKIYSYIKSKNHNDLMVMFRSINVALNKYKEINNEYKKISEYVKRLETEIGKDMAESGAEIYLHFFNENIDFSKFIEHFNSIQIIYDEIGYYINSETIDLKIIKIESGSFLDKLLGDKNIIKIICEILDKLIVLIFNKFTFEGKLARKKELADYLVTEIDLFEKLKSAGIDVDDSAKENLNKTFTIISKEVLNLASSSSRIQVNEKTYSVEESMGEKYLTEYKTLLIEDKE